MYDRYGTGACVNLETNINEEFILCYCSHEFYEKEGYRLIAIDDILKEA